MKQNVLIFATLGMLSFMVGCASDKNSEPTQTVDWYKTHGAERKDVLEKCKNNPGELAMTPNCVNASKADNQVSMGNPNKAIKPKPLTFENK
jgi:hypothetical protein